MLGCFLLELSKKIIQENELPARSTPPKTIDADTTPEYTPTVDNSLEEYIVADYLLNHHSEELDDSGSPDDYDDTDY